MRSEDVSLAASRDWLSSLTLYRTLPVNRERNLAEPPTDAVNLAHPVTVA